MKVYIVIMCISLAKLFATNANAQTITLNEEDTELKNILDRIETESAYYFFYNNSLINVSEKTSINVEKEKIDTVLWQLFSNTEINFRIFKNQIVLFPKNDPSQLTLFKELENQKEQNTITGMVTDEQGEPLPGVSVVLQGTTTGVQTDFDGNYQINANEGDVLVFSYLGMETKTKTIGIETTVNIILKENSTKLNEVVVVAYGTSNKEAITGSISSIASEKIEQRSITNISNVIEGSSPGVIVTAPSGQPGSGQSIRIRGFGSYGSSNDVLYVVDGIPINGDLSNLNPSDIESVNILKDAGSTALYGNKAANGVVLVTTKSGSSKEGQLKVNISTSTINRGTKEYDRLGPADFYEAYWEARRNAIAVPGIATNDEITAANIASSAGIYDELLKNPFNVPNNQIVGTDGKINPEATLLYPDDLDWVGALTRTGIRRTADLSFNSKSEKGNFYGSLGYLDEEGYLISSDFNRITGRVKGSYNATSWLQTGINISGTLSKSNQAQTSVSGSTINPFRFTRNMGSIYPIYQHDSETGDFILDENGQKVLDLIRGPGASSARHILYEIENDTHLQEINRLDGKMFAKIQLAKGLSFTNNMSYETENFYASDYYNAEIGDAAPSGEAARTYVRTTTAAFNQLLTYDFDLDDIHTFDVLAGHETQDFKKTYLYANMSTQIFQGNEELANFVSPNGTTSYIDEVKEDSYFGRIGYNYDYKYFLSGSIRTDGNSKFADGNKWGVFYSLGGSWSVHREKFLEDATWINILKIRASQGELGNANLGDGVYYPYLPLLGLGYNNQNEAGVLTTSLGSSDLKWEKSVHTDIAVEFGFFNRLRGSVEYFKKLSKDLIFAVPLPLSAGGIVYGDSQLQNVGELYNKGLELSLTYDIIQKDDFGWSATINASTIENKITKLPEGQETILTDDNKRLEVGRSLFDYYLRDWYGVDPADGSGLFVAADPTASDVRVIDNVSVTPYANNAQEIYAGSVLPDVYGSFNSNFRYKNFNFDFLFTYQIGGDNLDINYGNLMATDTYGSALHVDILDRWQQPGDITNVPRADVTMDTQWQQTSDRFLTDASYLSLRQMNASYNLPETLIKKIGGVTSIRFYANAENVFNLNARKGFNQQQDYSGNTSNAYVPSRSFSLGLNITL
ncbi:SusC/RagA family TonB-linked outer membrane protein [Maribacter polysiphoniae]|uniref:SusC/RagA family TonB-linked outer membrane protein n=1 Tax=Maribacter polysiphoniae TaxID=429344 RepID=UPI0023541E1B|nr:SusC/RagA family TonB-linked outer membrane protein [Maribacter polysiphoniae]